ncbi:unnamed protein product [Chilo suppressalis]|uniref:Glucose-1-phosphatase n=1 Tax=Chilo suppressalis TaxID=168631 RepID=A0ABN8L652_CHISP|nr:unnamed protein product [Chilo suppressalis]
MLILEHFIYFCVIICLSKSEEKTNKEANNNVILKQVVILSRHGLRSPLSKYLPQMTPNKWPSWREKPGYLTAKGKILEGYMGQYFSAWFNEKGLILNNNCPTKDEFYVYANIKQRTRASAKAFVDKAFPFCNVTVHHSDGNVDPIFNPVLHNTSAIFRQLVIEDMQRILKRLSLNNSYENIENILDYKNSELCQDENKCNLLTDKNKVIVMSGEKPNVFGPIKIGNSVVDAFVMQYYEGLPLENVAWGNVRSPKDWQVIMNLSRGYHNVIFNTSLIAHDISLPLIGYMKPIFFGDNKPKVALLMGHDANIYTVLKTLQFKPYSLANQYELTPIGGKLVFQKWFDTMNNVNLLKIEYVYQSSEQLRDTSELNLHNTPKFKLMELEKCKVDQNGFCLWDDFRNILENE